MESWLLCDAGSLAEYFGKGFKVNKMPAEGTQIEKIQKEKVYQHLAAATCECGKGRYSKGAHSFDILAQLDPNKVTAASPWAARFVAEVKRLMDT